MGMCKVHILRFWPLVVRGLDAISQKLPSITCLLLTTEKG